MSDELIKTLPAVTVTVVPPAPVNEPLNVPVGNLSIICCDYEITPSVSILVFTLSAY